MRSAAENPIPPLAETCASFKGFVGDEKRADRVGEVLSSAIQRCRRKVALRFYTVREVAAFFGVSLNTVQRVYRRLERKGVLTRVRGFETQITARVSQPRFAIRGVVSMPIWLPGFLQLLDVRRFFSQLDTELSRHRFVLEPVFYKQSEEVHPDFVDRVLKINPDYVIWHIPCPADRTTMHSIADTGVQMVSIQGYPGEFPGRTYRLSYDRGFQQGLKEWHASGEIDNIVVPHNVQDDVGGHPPTSVVRPGLVSPLPYRFAMYSDKISLSDYLQRLAPDPRTGIIFDHDMFYSVLCRLRPEMMLEIFRRHRVMVMRPVEIPILTALPDLIVDAVLFPWKLAARRIATDLSKGNIAAEPIFFEAKWHSRMHLADVAQSYTSE